MSVLSQKVTRRDDFLAILVLVVLWLVFFWRILTPITADQASLIEGDFSGQFVAFGAYQYARFADGEVPLWNPYNNGGLPFIADTQAAVFYPPRLLTIGISSLTGGWTYNVLQIEMAGHVLLFTLLMYGFVRRWLRESGRGGVFAGLVAAGIVGYGGFMTGYPPLQLALLEAAVWLPLVLLGLLEATRGDATVKPQMAGVVLAGFGLGVSWMAGHPQTSWFITYLVVAYWAFRLYLPGTKYRWRWFIAGVFVMGVISAGLAAVQLLPGIEYLMLTQRTGIGFDEKSNGFPVQDIFQILYPGTVSQWSPLYVGVIGLVLAAIGLLSRWRERWFWGGVVIVSFIFSLGGNSVLYHVLYNVLPGLRFFRGQERAAYLVTMGFGLLAAQGVLVLFNRRDDAVFMRRLNQATWVVLAGAGFFALGIFALWLGNRGQYDAVIGSVTLSLLIWAGFCALLLWRRAKPSHWLLALTVLLAFELFSVNIDNINYESIPASERTFLQPTPLIAQVMDDEDGIFRVDGFNEALIGNAASAFAVQDIRGISPLFLSSARALIGEDVPIETAWELFAVRYVMTGAGGLLVDAAQITSEPRDFGTVNLFKLDNSRPFALLLSDYVVVDSDAFARALLRDPNFDPRHTVILDREPELTMPETMPDDATVTVTDFVPESFTVNAAASENTLLSVAQVDYPGWRVQIDGETVEPLRAYGGLTALALPAGEHTVTFDYDPVSYRLGAMLSLVTWVVLGILCAGFVIRNRRSKS